MKNNAMIFANMGNPWITEKERAEGRIYETRVRGEADLPHDKSLTIRNNDGSVVVIDVKKCDRTPLYQKPVVVERGTPLVSLTNRNISLRAQLRRAIAPKIVKVK